MAGTAKKTADILNKIIEDIDTVNLKDRKAWEKILVDLEGLISEIPAKKRGALTLFGLCREGLELLSKKSVKDTLSLVGGISEALIALEEYLTNKKEDGGFSVIEAAKVLESVMGRPSTDWEGLMRDNKPEKAEAASGEDTAQTLDDIAARLILLEPDDLAEFSRLKKSLAPIAADSSYRETCREKIGQALQKIEAILDASASDPDLNITEVGGLLEDAMNEIEEDRKDEPVDQSTDPGVRHGDELDKGEMPEQSADPVPGDDNESIEEEPPERPSDLVSGHDDEPAAEMIFPESLPEDADLDLLGEFITESADLISEAEEALLTLESDPEDTEAVGSVFRAFHTVKGVSAFLELTFISEMAHHAESLLSRVRDKEIYYAGGYADLTLRGLDMIKQMIGLVQNALDGAPLSKPEGYDDLLGVLADPEGAGISAESDEIATADIAPRIGDILVAEGKAEREKVEEAAAVQDDRPIGVKMIKSQVSTVTDVAQALRTQEQIKGKKRFESSIRVSTSRLDRLIDMVGELVISHSIVAQDKVVTGSNDHELLRKISQTGKIVREMQDLSMSMRMVPLKATFSKMARLVRDVSRKVGKDVKLVTEGEDTEIDRNMVDVINDPLMHMVRNSVDHGIEMPEVRQKMGKPRSGTVKLSAYHAAGKVVVEIEDDGKGLSRNVILAKAKERGLVSDEASLSDREIFKMIFEPGFSTAETVTDVSGRGVGMDVVRKNIESLRGQIEIDSEEGKGSVFRMSLPLTLAIIDGMVVRVSSEAYIIPTVSIVTSLKPEPEQLSTVLNQGEMLSLHGDLLPLFRLADLFFIEKSDQDSDNRLVVVIEDDNKKRAGLIIDELIGRQQIVIKSLGETMKDIPGISGAAIMPNGQVGLILDVGGVVGIANSGNGGRTGEEKN
ncbi:MAG: chemotaxis protein CheA [Deltaproteobacteria bacterium]|nr:chemotaxis protein CheA [Deltaproteobacteria bacterium]